jgi:hypothetical protein
MSDVQPTQTTTLGRNWLLKTALFITLLLGFGVWGLSDAMYFYPKRGEMDAARRLKDHLAAAETAGVLTSSQLKVADPVKTYSDLKAKSADIAARTRGEGMDAKAARVEETRFVWLDALNRMWALRPEPRLVATEKASASAPARKHYFDMREGEGYTVAAGSTEKTKLAPKDLLGVLTTAINTSNQVTPLSGFDMLFQWVFVVIGFGGGLWMLLTLVRAAAKKYRWQPDTQALTMPNGKTVTPADIQDLDKRLWHKFFVVMHVKGGEAYRLDLLRYQPLEDWVLAMEKTAFPDRDAEEDGASPAQSQAPADSAA